jgi:site-specific recombinase XerD
MRWRWDTFCLQSDTPDISTLKGLRDRAIIAVLLGCGLRWSEVAVLTMAHIQQRDGRWVILRFGQQAQARPHRADAELDQKWPSTPGRRAHP